jgi:hypothetical protein
VSVVRTTAAPHYSTLLLTHSISVLFDVALYRPEPHDVCSNCVMDGGHKMSK